MATIDNLDLSIYNMYALRTKMIEETHKQLRLKEATGVPAHLQVVDTLPKLSDLDLLLGVGAVLTPWAFFLPPKRFNEIRRSPFSFSRVAPSFGSLDDEEELLALIDSVETNTKEEAAEKSIISACVRQMEKINDWMGFIIGRVGQFLQG